MLHKCLGIGKTKLTAHPQTPQSAPAHSIARENSHQAQETWQTQSMDTTGGDRGPQHCGSCSADPSLSPGLLTNHKMIQPYHSTVIYTHGFLPTTLTSPDIRPSRMISLSRISNFYFQGKKLNWQSKPFVKHKARNNTFSFKHFLLQVLCKYLHCHYKKYQRNFQSIQFQRVIIYKKINSFTLRTTIV